MVYPKDDTWFKNWHADDKGNPVIEQGVRIVYINHSEFGGEPFNSYLYI